jgi:hypothetical protein
MRLGEIVKTVAGIVGRSIGFAAAETAVAEEHMDYS